ncbi:non-ribosomal peptide synthetase [bacterium]|nr:non-ribosomal peptide synthetase [bacterium]
MVGKSGGDLADMTRLQLKNPFGPFEIENLNYTISFLFEQTVEKYPDRVAIRGNEDEICYSDLNAMADDFARSILSLGALANERIALMLQNDLHTLVSLLGIWKAGCVAVPIETSQPETKRVARLDHCAPSWIVQPGSVGATLVVARQGQAQGLPLLAEAAMLLYTSGSTGQPKGVIQTHRSFLRNVMAYTNGFHLSFQDRIPLLASCATGQGIATAFSTLLNGGTLYCCNLQEGGMEKLLQWMQAGEVTVLIAATTLFRYFIRSISGTPDFPEVRLVRLGSEPVLKTDFDLFRAYFKKDVSFANALSTTETGNFAQYFLNQDTELKGNKVPAGYPVDGLEVLVVDESGEETEPGEIGEIVVRSRNLSPGYWRPRTENGFRSNSINGEISYFTGDLGRKSADGCLEHLGRKDFRVKIRGLGVHLQEVEQAFSGYEGISSVAADVREDAAGDNCLVAYLVSEDGNSLGIESIRKHLLRSLPVYAVPTHFVFLDRLPLTPAGKLDRRALPQIESSTAEPAPDVREPVEALLIGLWRKVLRRNVRTIDDNFFDLGGDSLKAVLLFLEIERKFGRNFPISTLLEAPTIRTLAALLQKEAGAAPAATGSLIALQPQGKRLPFFCVPGAGGSVLNFRRLAQLLGPDQPFFGLQSAGLNGKNSEVSSIEAMAEQYCNEIRSVQPSGPYLLSGASFGAFVAFEMARQLEAVGAEVGFLGIFDQYPPGCNIGYQPPGLFRQLICHLEVLRSIPYNEILPYVVNRAKSLLQQRKKEIKNDTAQLPPPVVELLETHMQLGKDYAGGTYAGNLTFFRATRIPMRELEDLTGGWSRFVTGKLETILIPGDHAIWLNDGSVSLLAQQLRIRLAACNAGFQPAKP